MKALQSYSYIRGFNHEPDFTTYTSEQAERELGYAKRLGLNSCRLFMPIRFWKDDREGFLTKLLAFVRTAHGCGISTTPILLMAYYTDRQKSDLADDVQKTLIPGCYFKENYHISEKYVTDVVGLLKDEPGLLFWDLMNEPSYHDFIINITDEAEKSRRLEMVWEFVRHFIGIVRKLDPVNALGVGHTFIDDTEASKTGELVDILIFHDYLETRSRVEATCKRALELSEKYSKPVINNEMGCLCRANPYDAVIEIHDNYNIGWYIFKLMIEGSWQGAHGICYADGTVRDPSIVAAILGFFRNRDETAVFPDINGEGHVEKAIAFTREVLKHKSSAEELLEAAEYIVNLLECGELIPMAYPPSAKIAAYRRQKNPNIPELRAWLYSLVETIREACQLV